MKRNNSVHNILVCGVGGQGILLASELIAIAAMADGYDVKKSEVHGLSQRGGSVESHVRFGERVFSPIIPQGEVDVLLAFERAEALRWAHYLKDGEANVIVNDVALIPVQVTLGLAKYPEDIEEKLKKIASKTFFVDAYKKAIEIGNSKVFNVFLVGVASNFLPISEEAWMSAIKETVPPKTVQINSRAYIEGKKWVDMH